MSGLIRRAAVVTLGRSGDAGSCGEGGQRCRGGAAGTRPAAVTWAVSGGTWGTTKGNAPHGPCVFGWGSTVCPSVAPDATYMGVANAGNTVTELTPRPAPWCRSSPDPAWACRSAQRTVGSLRGRITRRRDRAGGWHGSGVHDLAGQAREKIRP